MQIKGVNLGNWLVLEKWMSSELFYGITGEDEEDFYSMLSPEEAKLRIRMHREYFIQERDFQRIGCMGLNLVRIPVPHFIFGNQEPYVGCIEYLDKAFAWAKRYGLQVLIDLHTVPDSQNGFDNGGLSGVVKWHLKKENIDYTLDVLEHLAQRYAGHEALYGIELLNEPISKEQWEETKDKFHPRDPERALGSTHVPTEVLKEFYLEGYKRVRKHCKGDVAVVLHDGFRLEEWENFMPKEVYENVVIDTHMYLNFIGHLLPEGEIADYEVYVKEHFTKRLQRASKYHKVVVGEWCIANKSKTLAGASDEEKRNIYQQFGAMQMKAWEHCQGWIYWSYKLHTPGRNDWDYQRATDAGWLEPLKKQV
jgi:aryl-phospho-beta-D-glucosidase BglC (GH1 family)